MAVGRDWRRWVKPAVSVACGAYLVAVIALYLMIRLIGERWLPVSLLLFGPRWMVALPAVPLMVTAVLARRRLAIGATLIALIVVVWPLMGFCVSWARLKGDPPTDGAYHLRVISFNAHEQSVPRDRKAWDEMIRTAQPDVIALQEWRGGPTVTGAAGGWYGIDDGELRLESRYPVHQTGSLFKSDLPSMGAATQFEIETPAGPVPFVVVHFASPHGSLRDAVQGRRRWGSNPTLGENTQDRDDQAQAIAQAAKELGGQAIVLGDFNLPSDSQTFRQSFGALTDAFVNDGGFGFGWTYTTRSTAVRIDHVLVGSHWRCGRAWVGPNVGSPHRPLIADLELVRPEPKLASLRL